MASSVDRPWVGEPQEASWALFPGLLPPAEVGAAVGCWILILGDRAEAVGGPGKVDWTTSGKTSFVPSVGEEVTGLGGDTCQVESETSLPQAAQGPPRCGPGSSLLLHLCPGRPQPFQSQLWRPGTPRLTPGSPDGLCWGGGEAESWFRGGGESLPGS